MQFQVKNNTSMFTMCATADYLSLIHICTCCGEKQRMLYSTEKSTNSTTEFVKMVVESR